MNTQEIRCSVCGKHIAEVEQMYQDSGRYICDVCLEALQQNSRNSNAPNFANEPDLADEPEPNEKVREFVLGIVNDELDYDCQFSCWECGDSGERLNERKWNHPLPTAYLYAYAKLVYYYEYMADDYDELTKKRIIDIANHFNAQGIDPKDVIDTFSVAWNIAQRVGMALMDNMAYGQDEIPCHAFLPRVYDSIENVPRDEFYEFERRMKGYEVNDVNLYIAFHYSFGIWTENLKKNHNNPNEIMLSLLNYKYNHINKKMESLREDYFTNKHKSFQMHPYIYQRLLSVYHEGLDKDYFSPIILVGDREQVSAIVEEMASFLQRNLIELDTSREKRIPDEVKQGDLLYIVGDKRGKSINYNRFTSIRRGTIVIYGLSACKDFSMNYMKNNLSIVLQDTFLNLNSYSKKSDKNEETTFLRKLADTAKLIYVRPESEKRLDKIRQSFQQFCSIRNADFDRMLPLLYLYSLEELYDLDFYKNSREFLSKNYTSSDKPTIYTIDRENMNEEVAEWLYIYEPIVLYSQNNSLIEKGDNYGLKNIQLFQPDDYIPEVRNRSSIPVIIDAKIGREKIERVLSFYLDEVRLIYIINDSEDRISNLGNKKNEYKRRGVMEVDSDDAVFAKISSVMLTKKIHEFFDKKLTLRIGPAVCAADDESVQALFFRDIRVERSYKRDHRLEAEEFHFPIGQEDAQNILDSRKNPANEKPFVILTGPSNVGKTTIIRWFAYKRHYAVYNLLAFDLLKPDFDKDIREMIDDMCEEAPVILHLDKLGSLCAEYERTKNDRIESSLYLLESLINEKHANNFDIRIIAESDETNLPSFLIEKALVIRCNLPTVKDYMALILQVLRLPVNEQVVINLAHWSERHKLSLKDVREGLLKVNSLELKDKNNNEMLSVLLEELGIREKSSQILYMEEQKEDSLHICPAEKNEWSGKDVLIPDGSEVLGKCREWLGKLFIGYISKMEEGHLEPIFDGIIHGRKGIGKSHLVKCLAGDLRNMTSGDIKGEAAEMYGLDLIQYVNREKSEIETNRLINDLRYVLQSIRECQRPAILFLENIDELHNNNLIWQMIGWIERLKTRHQVLVISSIHEPPTSNDHEFTYIELLGFLNNDLDIVDKLGGFVGMLPPTAIEYGAFLRWIVEGYGMSLGEGPLYEDLGEIFLNVGLTGSYRLLQRFILSCIEKSKKRQETLTPKSMLEELYQKINGRAMNKDDDDRKSVSCHEAGHAFVQAYFGEKSVLATVVSRGDYGGFVMPSRRNAGGLEKEEDWRNMICVSLAGRVAEQVLYYEDPNVCTAGAGGSDHSDLAKASRYAYLMVRRFGMGSKLFMPSENYSGESDLWTKECMDEADRILHQELEYTRRIISENRTIVENIAQLLEEEGTITADKIESCFVGNDLVLVHRADK